MTVTTLESRESIITAMQSPDFYDHDVSDITLIQTHISWVFLTGEYAYKVKKPMNFGFLNFTTLELRKHFCEEEIRLNSRLADKIYLETVRITGTENAPQLNGDGEAIEFAVKMKQFDQSQLVDRLLKNNELQPLQIDEIADQVAAFHQQIAISGDESPLGTADIVNAPVIQNFEQLDPLIKDPAARLQLERLKQWSETEFNKIEPLLRARKQQGFIRECHGDMHLGNMALIDQQITIFDGIEFNDEFRWIDVMSEVAFLYMDLYDRKATAYAHRFLNRYLEQTGDYDGLQVLRFYLVYRAMVRAKIASFTLLTPDLSPAEQQRIMQQYTSYTDLAERFTSINKAHLYITHGVSGCGKTTVSQQLLENNNLIRVRSDIERKRLYGLKPQDQSKSALDNGIYTAEASQRTYKHLLNLAKMILECGYSAIIDATFLEYDWRAQFQALASQTSADFKIVSFEINQAELEQRVKKRTAEAKDASEADIEVLHKQLASLQPLNESEKEFLIIV